MNLQLSKGPASKPAERSESETSRLRSRGGAGRPRLAPRPQPRDGVQPGRNEALRRVFQLAAAGLTSALVFVLLNPYWKAYLHFIRGLQRDYALRTDASRFEIPRRIAEMHVGELLFGPVLGAVALLAFAVLIADFGRRAMRAGDRPTIHRLAMFLAFPLAYTVAYAAQTSYFKANNFLPVVPFTVLALAWLLDGSWRRLGARWPAVRRAVVGWTAAALLVAFLAQPGYRYVAHSVVPTTVDAARLWLHQGLDPAAARLVYREAWQPPKLAWEGIRQLHGGLSAEVEVEEIDWQLAPDADAVILRLDRSGRDDPEARLREAGFTEILRSEPRLFRLRGPPLLTATRPWHYVDKIGFGEGVNKDGVPKKPLAECGPGCFAATLSASEIEEDERLVVFLWLPTSMAPPSRAPRLFVGHKSGQDDTSQEIDLPLHHASHQVHGHLYVSPRVGPRVGPRIETALDADVERTLELRFIAPQDYGPGLGATQVEIHRWQPPPG